MEFVRGSVMESVTNLGSYKKVASVYFPFSMEMGGARRDPGEFTKIILDTVEANVPIDASEVQNACYQTGQVRREGVLRCQKLTLCGAIFAAPLLFGQAQVRFDSGTVSGLPARNIGSAMMSGRITSVSAVNKAAA